MTDELSKLDRVLSLLEDVRENDKGFRARCPVHGGRTLDDLYITLGRKWINLHCFAGCAFMDIVRALNLQAQDLLVSEDESQKVRRRPVSARERELTVMACGIRLAQEPTVLTRLRYERSWAAAALEALSVGWDGSRLTLPVRDADGKLHDTLRYDPFSTLGRKVLAGKGKSRLPWPAPEMFSKPVLFLVEGEGTAISMYSIGLPAVGLPGSLALNTNVVSPGRWRAGGWHRSWTQRFSHFRELVLLPDCDGPGRALMGAARYDLERAGIKATIVDLDPQRHDGSDIADLYLKDTYNGERRRIAKELVRETIAHHDVLVAA